MVRWEHTGQRAIRRVPRSAIRSGWRGDLYSLYGGSPLRKLVSIEEKSLTGRAVYILGQRAAVMP